MVGWGDDEAVQLAEVLPLRTSATALHLTMNKISARGAKGPRGGVCRGRDAEAQETLPPKQPDWRRGRGGPRGGGWEGRAADAGAATVPRPPRLQQQALKMAKDALKGRPRGPPGAGCVV